MGEPSRSDDLVRLIREIRGAFQDLKRLGDALHAEDGINASMRAVLEHLDEAGPATTPAMAAAKNVSRQHIQTLVDALLEAGLLERRANPAHKRSPLIAMTREGRAAYARIQAREAALLASLSSKIDGAALAPAAAALASLRAAVRKVETGGPGHD